MWEDMTFENILNDMLSRVTSDVDKREGSIVYDALAPAAYKLAEVYFMLDYFIDLVFGDTAVGEYLDRVVADHGLTRKSATYAIRKIETSGIVDIGTRWGVRLDTPVKAYDENGDEISVTLIPYTIIAKLDANNYSAECYYAGEVGNQYSGVLENIDHVSGVTATLTGVITAAADKETDDELRKRLQESIINPAQNGNAAQYKKWAIEYPGVGTAKVFPLWNGGNTVKVAITNAQYLPAESGLVEEFQKYIDPGSEGKGNGIAPIGSKVTVTGGVQKSINVAANVVLAEGYNEPTGAAQAISGYLASIVYEKESVSYMRIGSALLDCQCIADLNNLTVNSGVIDIPLIGEEIPVLVNLNLTVVSE